MTDSSPIKVLQVFICLILFLMQGAFAVEKAASLVDCYEPVPGGWHLRISGDPNAKRLKSGERLGIVAANDAYSANPRLHRRPLFPPADRSMIFTPDQLTRIERIGFRPLVLAYAGPRFLFDFHSAGGLLGHLYCGLIAPDGNTSKWFHQWAEIDVSYVNGYMEYVLKDPAFPGVTVTLEAIPLANSAGLLLKIDVKDAERGTSLVWAYGGASAYFTNWAMNAPEFDFAPKQCLKDICRWEDGDFSLSRSFDNTDIIMNEVFAAPKKLPDWQAVIRGGSSWKGRCGFGDPNAFTASPADLVKTMQSPENGSTGKNNCVVVEQIPLSRLNEHGYVAVGMGGNISDVMNRPKTAWKAAHMRCDSIAERIVTHTPDPYLDAAVPMMAFATEGTWGDTAVLHGAWSWRFAYLGWRGWYGTECYGWTDRIKKSIQNMVRLNRVTKGSDEGALGSLLEYDPGVFYNMNEVFLDQVRQYFDYTNDLDLMREIFPVLEGILKWEDRRLRPTEDPLYENALNTWISDQHWYTRGQCTQASAYMLNANRFLADLAPRLGISPAPFRERAEKIRAAMQQKLWQTRTGVYAEYLDTRGNKLLHPEPELPTIYHSAEFGAADLLQINQMLDWAHTNLRAENTPDGGKLYWSSNWFPNMARSYTHSTLDLVYAENLNFALTHYLAGRADDAYAIQRGCFAGIFNGVTPGSLECHAYVDGRGRANDDFTDAISMWGRTLVEGLFGIVPKRPDGIVELSPQFPKDWPEASIDTPQFSYRWKYGEGKTTIDWTAPAKTAIHLRMPIAASRISEARVDGKPVEFNVEPGVELSWIVLKTPTALKGRIEVAWTPSEFKSPNTVEVKQGESLRINLPQVMNTALLDPQGILTDGCIKDNNLEGTVTGKPGPALLFATLGTQECPFYMPVRLRITPKTPSPAPRVWSAPAVPDHDLKSWVLVDMKDIYNASVPDVMQRVWDVTKPPPAPSSEINTLYYKDHLIAPFVNPKPSDDAWRKKIDQDGIGWTTDGIPFKSVKTGSNIAVATLAGAFPTKIAFPVDAAGKTLYLMISGTTFAMQTHVVNLRFTLCYSDGSEQNFDKVNPFDIGDCWNQYRFHDTAANGFENIGGRSGPAGSREAKDLTKPVPVDTEAHLMAIEMEQGLTLKTIRMEPVANDVIFGVMGATVLK